MSVEVLPVKVFTRDEPCTKVDIHNCFTSPTGYAPVPVVTARGKIGLNVPKYLLREGFAVAVSIKNIDYYDLTTTGVEWLEKGLKRHLELHPDDAAKVIKHRSRPPIKRAVRTAK